MKRQPNCGRHPCRVYAVMHACVLFRIQQRLGKAMLGAAVSAEERASLTGEEDSVAGFQSAPSTLHSGGEVPAEDGGGRPGVVLRDCPESASQEADGPAPAVALRECPESTVTGEHTQEHSTAREPAVLRECPESAVGEEAGEETDTAREPAGGQWQETVETLQREKAALEAAKTEAEVL